MAARLAQAQTRLAKTEARIEGVERRMLHVRSDMMAVQRALSDKARAAYVSGGTRTVELLLSSSSFDEFSDRIQYLGQVTQEEADLLNRARITREKLRRYEEQLSALRSEQQALAAALAREEAAIHARLDQVAAEVAELEDRLAAERAAAREAARLSVPVFAGGALQACPAGQPRAYSDDFGAPRSGGRSHQGNDIIAPMGTPVYAAQSGRFEQNYNDLGGISALVYAPNGDYTYYAHMSSYAGVASGASVSAGTQIGHVGNTGNASGGITHLHFEYHPGGGGAVDPYPYLQAVCG
jgi:peptidoglycan LD-endopeptidase LytH